MKINRAYKFRLYPTQSQQGILEKTFGCCRFLWNLMLHERISTYQRLKDKKDELYSYKYKTEKQYKQNFSFLKEVDSRALQSSRDNLYRAFKNFFNGIGKWVFLGSKRGSINNPTQHIILRIIRKLTL